MMRDHTGKDVNDGVNPPLENGLSQKEGLPTIQIDTVPSPPWSPVELSPSAEDEPLDTEQIEIQLEEEKNTAELRESLREYIKDVLSKAMVVAEKKLQFFGLDDEDEEDEEEVEALEEQPEENSPEAKEEVRATAEKVVEEVLTKAQDAVQEKLDKLPVLFDEAPAELREVASKFIKEVVGKAVALAEEKAVPTVPFNFEDVDLIKRNGPWYVRVREGFLRVLRSACFCTPQRNDS